MTTIPPEVGNALLEYSRRQKDTDAMYRRQLDCTDRKAPGAYIAATKKEAIEARKFCAAAVKFFDSLAEEENSR